MWVNTLVVLRISFIFLDSSLPGHCDHKKIWTGCYLDMYTAIILGSPPQNYYLCLFSVQAPSGSDSVHRVKNLLRPRMFENVFNLLSHLMDNLAGHRILAQKLFSSRILKTLLNFLVASSDNSAKAGVILILGHLYIN